MNWQNPWALAGLSALLLPILIHLLSRKRASVQRFPTLRFLNVSRLLPTRRTRLSDVGLLLLRLMLFTAVVVSLAGPRFGTSGNGDAPADALARAIVVDTSVSMSRLATSGERLSELAMREATRLASEAGISTILETGNPAEIVGSAVAWLDAQHARGEIAVLSDFQRGTLDSSAVASIPSHYGVRTSRFDAATTASLPEWRWSTEAGVFSATAVFTERSTQAEWRQIESAVSDSTVRSSRHSTVSFLAGPAELVRVKAAATAAQAIAPAVTDTAKAVVFVFPEYESRVPLLITAAPVNLLWMANVIGAMRRDSILIAASSSAVTVVPTRDSARYMVPLPYVVVARNDAGQPVAFAALDTAAGAPGNAKDRLIIYVLTDAGSATSAALIASVNRALASVGNGAELDPLTVSSEALASWQRTPASQKPNANSFGATSGTNGEKGTSDARWFWVGALILFGLEHWLRTRPEKVRNTDIRADALS